MRKLALLLFGIVLITGCDNKYSPPPTIPIPEGEGPKGAPNVGIPAAGAEKGKPKPSETSDK